ncbi:MAG: LmbE family protein [Gemmatimonadetes bacterium]|jgi:LmbE family N-acetylglucosaminyl deacetylase|nr:LmbE family protein [Gemmatimonadota bacterium]
MILLCRLALATLLLAPRLLAAQERGATALGEAVAGLDVTARVLLVGAHPDDEDTQLLTWLARGRQVETGYLSLTRGDGGQNLIGNELGPLLGMIRTEELLAARRLDGGRQFFTRAYDFGFSKSAEETYTHWPRDSVLRDMVTVVRAFRPQVIVAVFSGTPRDGHGHHQVSGILAREVFDAAADTVRFPRSTTLGLGPWSPAKFYRAARFAPQEATVAFNVGELSALRGQSYAEIASESRSQHLSQGFGSLQRRGTSMDYLKLEASRVGTPAARERSPLDSLATGWNRFGAATLPAASRGALDSLDAAIAAVRRVEDLTAPWTMVTPLARVAGLLDRARAGLPCPHTGYAAGCFGVNGDLALSLETAQRRAQAALLSAAGVLVEATAPRELLAVHDTMPVTVTVYNQGRGDVRLEGASVWMMDAIGPGVSGEATTVPPDSAARLTLPLQTNRASVSWWMERGLQSGADLFNMPPFGWPQTANIAIGEDRVSETHTRVALRIAGESFIADAGPVVYRYADPARGERRRPVASVLPVSLLFEDEVEYARTGVTINRDFTLSVRSSSSAPRGVTVELSLPAGLTTDSLVRRVALPPFGGATLVYHVRGRLPAGRHFVNAVATSNGERSVAGWLPITYEHIRPLRYYRIARVQIEAVDAALPRDPTIAYIRGVGDNVAPMLHQLGIGVTLLTPELLATADLSRYGAVVVGPRAFAASPLLTALAPRLQDYARRGGTVVVQYGQAEIQAPGVLPYPVTLARTAERVTDENAPVTVLDPRSPLLASPNRITPADFADWVQERATYMPTSADPRYQRLLEMHDPGEPANANAVLVAPLGKGAFVYTTLALFRQLPAGKPGPARIFLNLLAANGKSGAPVQPVP